MGASKDCVCRNYSADKYTETNVVKLCAICICVFLPHQTGGLRFHTHTHEHTAICHHNEAES